VISERIGKWVRRYMLHVGEWFAGLGMTANMATLVGLGLNAIVAIIIAFGYPVVGGVLLLVASAFDMVDGAIARATNSVSKFGGFFDSTLDRYSEIVVYVGLLIWLNQTGDDHLGAVLVLVTATGALCLIINQPMWALWILAIATHLTAVWRIVHVWRVTSADGATASTSTAASAATTTTTTTTTTKQGS
jgi:CDP-diacylglycerol--glycerol-3-phosphate 3-phosphatidyltransferase